MFQKNREGRRHQARWCSWLAALCVALGWLPAAQAASKVIAQVDGIKAAENGIQTSSGRIFVSSDGSLYEMRRSAAGAWSKSAVGTQFLNRIPRACYYLGMTEYANTLYSVCTESSLDPVAPKHLMAMDLGAATATLSEIAPLLNVGLPNGMASDNAGNLFFSNLATVAPGQIWRIKLSSRFVVASQGVAYQYVDLNPNGMKYAGGKLYVTANPPLIAGVSQLQSFPVSGGNLGVPSLVYCSVGFLDDFALVQGGMVLARYLNGELLHITEDGIERHRAVVTLPTSPTLLKGAASLPGGTLLVTSQTNAIVMQTTDWGLLPR